MNPSYLITDESFIEILEQLNYRFKRLNERLEKFSFNSDIAFNEYLALRLGIGDLRSILDLFDELLDETSQE